MIPAANDVTREMLTGLDVITKVNDLYNSAWNNLMWTIGITGLAVTILVTFISWLITYLQNKSFEKEKKEIMDKFVAENKKMIEELDQHKKDTIDKINKIEKETANNIKQVIDSVGGSIFVLHGEACQMSKEYLRAIDFYSLGLVYLIKQDIFDKKDNTTINKILSDVKDCIDKLDKAHISKLNATKLKDVIEVIKKEHAGKYEKEVDEIETSIKNKMKRDITL